MKPERMVLLCAMTLGLTLVVAWMVPWRSAHSGDPEIYERNAHDQWMAPLRSGRVLRIRSDGNDRQATSRASTAPVQASMFTVRTFGRLPAASAKVLLEGLKQGVEKDEADARRIASVSVSARDRFAEGGLLASAYMAKACISLLERGDYFTVLSGSRVPEPDTHDVFQCGLYRLEDGTAVEVVFYVDKADPTYSKILEYTIASREQMFEDMVRDLNRLDPVARQARHADSLAAIREIRELDRSNMTGTQRAKALEQLQARKLHDELEFDPQRVEFRRRR